MRVDLKLVFANWQSILVALLAVLLVKAVVTAGLLRIGGSRTGVAAETGVLMASPSETTLIVLGSATAAQLIRPETAAFWQIVTALGLTVTPMLARLGRMAGRRIDPKWDAALAEALQAGRSGQGGDRRLRPRRPDRRRHALDPRPRLYRHRCRCGCGRRKSAQPGYPVLFGDVRAAGACSIG